MLFSGEAQVGVSNASSAGLNEAVSPIELKIFFCDPEI
jgi:hypothetical protein